MKKRELQGHVDLENDGNQSCPPIMEEDITRSINEKYVRNVHSQEFKPSTESQFQKRGQKQKQHSPKKLQRKPIYHEKSFSQQKIEIKITTHKKGTDFDCEKVESIEMSCEEESYRSASIRQKSKKQTDNENNNDQPRSHTKREHTKKDTEKQLRTPHLRKKEEQLKEEVLNVLVAGAEDTGKTMFIRCFKRKERRLDEPHIKPRTRELKYELGMVDENLVNRRNTVYFIDLPGFSDSEKDKYLRQIEQYALTQWKQYEQKKDDDRRIHCCLYFLRGPRIKETDVYVMRELGQMFNLIPIIAKSDQYTKEEILEMKEEFHQRVREANVQLFDIEEFYRLKLGTERINELMQSAFGRFPPFVIASSYEKESPEAVQFVRKYPWGRVEIENREHTDFEKLSEILVGDMRSQLVNKLVNLVDRRQEEEERVEVMEGVIGGGGDREENKASGWKAKLVAGSVVVALVYAFVKVKRSH